MGVAVVEEAVDHEERALSFLSARRSPRAGLGLIALSGIAFSLAYLCFFFNWPRNDDLQLVELVTDWNAHSMTLRDVLASRNAEHPIGMQALAHLAIFETFGENYKFIVLFNDLILIISAATLFVAVRSHFSSVLSIVIAFVITLILFHPVQTDSLIWPYQTGWFLINLAFIINICLIERFAWKSLPLLVLSATCATLSSRHGIIAWPVMAVQLALLGGWRNWVAALIMFIGLAAALVAVPSTNTTSLPGIADAGDSSSTSSRSSAAPSATEIRNGHSDWARSSLHAPLFLSASSDCRRLAPAGRRTPWIALPCRSCWPLGFAWRRSLSAATPMGCLGRSIAFTPRR